MRVVAKVLVNPKFFFSYAKNRSRVKCSIGPLSGTLTNPSETAELLQEQCVSVFSNPAAEKQLPMVLPSPPSIFQGGGGGGLFWHWKVPIFNSQFKNNSTAAGYYVITPFSENNMVNTVN